MLDAEIGHQSANPGFPRKGLEMLKPLPWDMKNMESFGSFSPNSACTMGFWRFQGLVKVERPRAVPGHAKSLKNIQFLSFFKKKWCWRSSFEVHLFDFRRMLRLILLFLLKKCLWVTRTPKGYQGGIWAPWLVVCKPLTSWLALFVCKPPTSWLVVCKPPTSWLVVCEPPTSWLVRKKM